LAIILPFIFFAAVLLFLVVNEDRRANFSFYTSLPVIGFHLASLATEIAFIVGFIGNPLFFDYGVAILVISGFDLIFNAGTSSLVLYDIVNQLPDDHGLSWATAGSYFISLFGTKNLCMLLLFVKGTTEKKEEIRGLLLRSYSFHFSKLMKCIGVFAVGIIALIYDVPSSLPLMITVQCGCTFLWDLTSGLYIEMTEKEDPFARSRSNTIKRESSKKSMEMSDINLPTFDEKKPAKGQLSRKASTFPIPLTEKSKSEDLGSDYAIFLARLVSPFVLLSFIPFIFSIIGIPLARLSLRRFKRAFDGYRPMGSTEDKLRLTSMAAQGLFLLPVSLVLMTPVFVVFLATNLILMFVLYLSRFLLGRFLKERLKLHIDSCHHGYRTCFGYLIWTYLPFLEEFPTVRTNETVGALHVFVMVMVFLLFIVTTYVLPVVFIVLDFIYSVSLLDALGDPRLPPADYENLFTLVVLSFVFPVFNCLTYLGRVVATTVLLFIHHGVLGSANTPGAITWVHLFYDFALDPVAPTIHLIAGATESKSRKRMATTLLVLNVVVGLTSLVQMIIKLLSVSYVGTGDTIFIVTLTFSVVSLAYSISSQLTKIALNRAPAWLKTSLNAWLFIIVGALLAGICSKFAYSRFCEIPKTLSQSSELDQIVGCPIISFDMIFFRNLLISDVTFHASAIDTFNATDNPQFSSLLFDTLPALVDPFIVSGNPVLDSVILSKLLTLTDTDFVVSNNPALSILSTNYLGSVLSNMIVSGNAISPILDLPTLADIQGLVSVADNMVPFAIRLAKLQRLEGQLSISGNNITELYLPAYSIHDSDATLVIDHNVLPSDISFPLLNQITGVMNFTYNVGVSMFQFPSLETYGGSLLFEGNSDLVTLDLSGVVTCYGTIVIRNNPNLVNINFGLLSEVQSALIIIDGNEQITSVTFPVLEWRGDSIVQAMNNPKLATVLFPIFKDVYPARYFQNNSAGFAVLYDT